METTKATSKELNEDLEDGFITTDFSIKELVGNAIIKEDYNDKVFIVVQNCNNEDVKISVNVKDYLTPSEHSEVIKLNEGI